MAPLSKGISRFLTREGRKAIGARNPRVDAGFGNRPERKENPRDGRERQDDFGLGEGTRFGEGVHPGLREARRKADGGSPIQVQAHGPCDRPGLPLVGWISADSYRGGEPVDEGPSGARLTTNTWCDGIVLEGRSGHRATQRGTSRVDQRTSFVADSMGIRETSCSTASLTLGSSGRHARTVTRPTCRRQVPTSSQFTMSAPGHTDLGHNSDRYRGCGTSIARSGDARYGSPAGSRRTVSTGTARFNLERSVRRAQHFRPSSSTSVSSFSRERNVCCASESSPRVADPKDPVHPPVHQANSLGIEGPTDRRNRRASSRRAGSGASVGGSTSRQDVVAPSHSILTAPVIDAILNSRKFTPTARLERRRSGWACRARNARVALSAAAFTVAPKTGLRGKRPSVKTATS